MHGKLKPKGLALTRLHVRVRSPHCTHGRLVGGGFDLAATIGRSGLSALKREGDGASPRGRFRIVGGFYRPDRFGSRPRAGIPLVPLRPDDGWCDDPAHPLYNRPARLPLRASAETMRREDGLYDVVIVTDHNQRPRVRGRGSAIFFHIAREGFSPTQGCVAIAPAAMRRLLPRLAREVELTIE